MECENVNSVPAFVPLTQKIHVAAALFTPGLGGIARVARNTARALIETGVDVSLLSLSDEAPVEVAGRVASRAYGSKVRFLAHCHAAAITHGGFIYDFLGTARAHPRLPGFKRSYVVWIHGIEVWGDLSTERKNVLRRAGLVLSNSSYTLARFEEKHGTLQQARVCQLGTEEDKPSSMPATFSGPPTALIVARMDDGNLYKGHREIIEVWPKIVSAVPDARLVIVGSGTGKDSIITHAANSSASTNIDVKGFLSEAELAQVWSQAHVFAMPSRGEGFGLVYIEAMRHGIPVIASVHDAGQEVNLDGVTGYNIDLNSKDALEERLIDLLGNPDRSSNMGRAGQERWQAEFRYSAFKNRLIEVLG